MKVILAGALLSLPTFCPYSTGSDRKSFAKPPLTLAIYKKTGALLENVLKLGGPVSRILERMQEIEKKREALDTLKKNGELGEHPNEVKQMSWEELEKYDTLYLNALESMCKLEKSIRTLIWVLGYEGAFDSFEDPVQKTKKICSRKVHGFSPEQNEQLKSVFNKSIELSKKLRDFAPTTDDSGKADQDIVNRLKETTEWQDVRRAQVALALEMGNAKNALDITNATFCATIEFIKMIIGCNKLNMENTKTETFIKDCKRYKEAVLKNQKTEAKRRLKAKIYKKR